MRLVDRLRTASYRSTLALIVPLLAGCSEAPTDAAAMSAAEEQPLAVGRDPHLPPIFDTCTAYVSTTGSDSAAGDRAHPFATLERARDHVRAIKATVHGPIDVCLRGGVYRLSRTFRLEPGDSGTASSPITYRSYAGERAVLSGGEVLALQWTPYAGGVYVADTPADFNSLFVNDQRAVRARTPNGDATFRMTSLDPENPPPRNFLYEPGSLPPGLVDTDVEVVSMARFVSSRQTIASTDATRATSNGSVFSGYGFDYETRDRYYVENTLSALDSPGEWYLDRGAHKLYYWPKSPAELCGTFTAGRLHQLVSGGSYPEGPAFQPEYAANTPPPYCRHVGVYPRTTDALSFARASFSVATWIRFPPGTTNPFWAFSKGNPWGTSATGAGGHGYGLATYSDTDDVLVQLFVNDGTHRIAANLPAIARDAWVHVAFVVDREHGRMKSYANGAPIDDQDIAALGSIDAKEHLDIGAFTNVGCSASAMSDLRIYAKALSPAEIAAVAAGAPTADALALAMPFDGDARDASPFAHETIAFRPPAFAAGPSGRRAADFGASPPVDPSGGLAHVAFANLAFEQTDWAIPFMGYAGSQAATTWASPSAVYLHGHDLRVRGSSFRHVGSHALAGTVASSRIEDNDFQDIGASAIALGRISDSGSTQVTLSGATSHDVIRGNRIASTGVVVPDSVAMLVLTGEYDEITRNTVTRAPNSAMSIGWFGSEELTNAGHHRIAQNRIDHVMELVNDGSGIYTAGNQPGTVVERNVIHDVVKTAAHASGQYIWGIYVDGNSRHIVAQKNLIYRTQGGGIMLNAAEKPNFNHDNVATNNILVDGVEAQVFLNYASLDAFTRNIVYSRRAPEAPLFAVKAANAILTSNRNDFFSAAPATLATELGAWRALGFDADSIVADPMFVDYAHDDFRLRPESPALLPVEAGGIGFEPIDFSGVP
jgi:hypothetical protein